MIGIYIPPHPQEHLLEPKRLRDPFTAGDWKQRNQRQTVLGCWGGRGPNLSVLASFPQGWDLGERQIQNFPDCSGCRRPELEANWEIFVPQVRRRWSSPGSSFGTRSTPVGELPGDDGFAQRKGNSRLCSHAYSPQHSFIPSSEVSKQFPSSECNSYAKEWIFFSSSSSLGPFSRSLCSVASLQVDFLALGVKFPKSFLCRGSWLQWW